MRYPALALGLLLLATASSNAATIRVKVVSRDPDKELTPVNGFQVEVTRPGEARPRFTSDAVNLPLSADKKSAEGTITIPPLGLGATAEVIMTFSASGRVPARLELAGNQDQTLVLILPTLEEMSYPYVHPPADCCLPYIPCQYDACWTPRRKAGIFSRVMGR